MNTFLADKGQMSEDEVIRISSDCLNEKVQGISKIGGGKNSKVFQVACSSQQYVVKFYFRHPADPRDRLGVEFKSFSFLWEQGLKVIPRPVAQSVKYQCAFYEFIKGDPLKDLSQADIDKGIIFFESLRNITAEKKDLGFSGASESFFSLKDAIDSIQRRLDRIDTKITGEEYDQLYKFLNESFIPLFKTVKAWSKDYWEEKASAYDALLAPEFRTLSPSDFGFHNALRMTDGKIVFLDFEYFGWDDPAKTVSDFLWHPAMNLSEELKRYFALRMSMVFTRDPHFKARVKSVFPLSGLKWCLILLNEFIPTDLERRDFAHSQVKNKTDLRLEQLAKARLMSQEISTVYKDFPYGY